MNKRGIVFFFLFCVYYISPVFSQDDSSIVYWINVNGIWGYLEDLETFELNYCGKGSRVEVLEEDKAHFAVKVKILVPFSLGECSQDSRVFTERDIIWTDEEFMSWGSEEDYGDKLVGYSKGTYSESPRYLIMKKFNNSESVIENIRQINNFPVSADETIYWINDVDVNCYDIDGNWVEMYCGLGSIVEILGENPTTNRIEIRIVRSIEFVPSQRHFGELRGEGKYCWIDKTKVSSGSKKDYILSVKEVFDSSSLITSNIIIEPSERKKKEAQDFWRRLNFQNPFTIELVKSALNESKKKRLDLISEKEHRLSEVVYLISLVRNGRVFLRNFLKFHNRNKIYVESIRSSGLGLSYLVKNPGTKALCCSMYPDKQIIFLDYKSALIELARSFVHEGTHATDEENIEESFSLTMLLTREKCPTRISDDTVVFENNKCKILEYKRSKTYERMELKADKAVMLFNEQLINLIPDKNLAKMVNYLRLRRWPLISRILPVFDSYRPLVDS